MRFVTRQNRLSSMLETNDRTAESEVENLTKALRSTHAKLRRATMFEPDSRTIPESVWRRPEFPEELALLVDEVMKNASLQLPAEIRWTFSIVCTCFVSRQEKMEFDMRHEHDAFTQMKSHTDEFIRHMTQVLPPELDIESVLKSQSDRARTRMKNYLEEVSDELTGR
jgi:hypothetical protein